MGVIGYSDLKLHVGHKIFCRHYNRVDPVEVTIKCETCHEILYSEFKTCPNCLAELDEHGKCTNNC